MKRQGWTHQKLSEPETVYELSFRLGTSYSATSHALDRHKVISNVNEQFIFDCLNMTLILPVRFDPVSFPHGVRLS